MSAERARQQRPRGPLGGLVRGRFRSLALALCVLASACVLSPSPDLPGAENDAGMVPSGSGGSAAAGGHSGDDGIGGSPASAGGLGGNPSCGSTGLPCGEGPGGSDGDDSTDGDGQAGGSP